ncbi:hypothetical protein JOF29_000494 [Kribbella aluminosa]|uniref:Uncharacterized protein n=1 Tax=Kribbella aluminosa TaxID=416017 RepID=A0ABS4UCP6_9ACTN|nr:acyltransferase domain-containing protein [Kribbella aluminosa]MBP2349411.1 hypothetical protein [Kribbella aluminosa]
MPLVGALAAGQGRAACARLPYRGNRLAHGFCRDEVVERLCGRFNAIGISARGLRIDAVDRVSTLAVWPAPVRDADCRACLFVSGFLAAIPHVRDYHATIGLTDNEYWDSLSALGEELKHATPG